MKLGMPSGERQRDKGEGMKTDENREEERTSVRQRNGFRQVPGILPLYICCAVLAVTIYSIQKLCRACSHTRQNTMPVKTAEHILALMISRTCVANVNGQREALKNLL